jgi:transcriptional regulator with XRE-family HTH domain
MTGDGIDGRIDGLVKARWLAIGLSQTDIAEVLNAAFQQTNDNGSKDIDADRLTEIAEALDIPIESLHIRIAGTGQQEPDLAATTQRSLQFLDALRLARALGELRDDRTKQLLVHLAEQIVKRQANRRGDAG